MRCERKGVSGSVHTAVSVFDWYSTVVRFSTLPAHTWRNREWFRFAPHPIGWQVRVWQYVENAVTVTLIHVGDVFSDDGDTGIVAREMEGLRSGTRRALKKNGRRKWKRLSEPQITLLRCHLIYKTKSGRNKVRYNCNGVQLRSVSLSLYRECNWNAKMDLWHVCYSILFPRNTTEDRTGTIYVRQWL